MKVKVRNVANHTKGKIREDIGIEVDHLLVTDTEMERNLKTDIEVVHLIQNMKKEEENEEETVRRERKRRTNVDD